MLPCMISGTLVIPNEVCVVCAKNVIQRCSLSATLNATKSSLSKVLLTRLFCTCTTYLNISFDTL